MGAPKKLLILYYNFPPVKVPGAVRIHHFYKAALPWFDAIHVLATSNRRFFLQDSSLETGCQNIHEVPAWDLRRLTIRKTNENAPFVSSSLKERPLMRLLRQLVDSFPLNILIGDGGLIYILTGYLKARRLIKQEGITHVFSTFRPYSDHIIGYLLKGRFPEVYWIADFRDLHVDPVRKNTLCPPFQRWCNRQILRRTDLVTTVSEGLKREIQKLAPRVRVLRNGIGELSEEDQRPVKKFARFTISYTGALYTGKSDPGPLLEVIHNLLEDETLPASQTDLCYAGPTWLIWDTFIKKYGLDKITNNLGYLSRAEALAIQEKSHINLLLTWSTGNLKGVLTGKLFEYLAADTPILALINGPSDPELAGILSRCDRGAAFSSQSPGQKEQMRSFILEAFGQWKEELEDTPKKQPDYLKPYTWQVMMEQFIKELP
ncbi:MAG: hypothetical protein KDC75_23190 [Phaeodactylibacter sp.]|nr:hypothetical protein [Phaeodactylibacter sp.]